MIEMGKISSRGQIAIPSSIRESLGFDEGSRVLFFTQDDTLMIRKVTEKTFEEITKPFKEIAKKAGWKEKGVVDLVHKARKK